MTTPFMKFLGTVGAGIATVFIAYNKIDDAADVTTYPYPKEEFGTRSTGGDLLQWDVDKPVKAVEDLANDPFKVMQLAEIVAPRARRIEGYGETDYLSGQAGHAYFHVSKSQPVPKKLIPLFTDLKSYLPLRGLLSMFPPFGGEVPQVARVNRYLDYTFDETNPIDDSDADRAVIEYRNERMATNVPLSGAIQLGNVFVKASHCNLIANERFVVRYVMMNTSELHALDGRVLWMQAYDIENESTFFYSVGAGRHSIPFIDKVNNHTAGLVFSVMHRSLASMLHIADQQGVARITDGVSSFAWSKERLLADHDKALAARRALAASFDVFSRSIALARMVEGMDIVDVPVEDDQSSGGVSLFAQPGSDWTENDK